MIRLRRCSPRSSSVTAYAPDLAAMRLLADEHGPSFWQENLYNLWLGCLRELAPKATSGAEDAAELPPVARSEAWGRRLLNTTLASWAELRHDTILYVKQSYTSGAACEFPDAYVDPYRKFFERVAGFAEHGSSLLSSLELEQTNAAPYAKGLPELLHDAG